MYSNSNFKPKSIFLVFAVFLTMSLSAQDEAYQKAKNEIQETFGSFPSMFDVFPKHALSGAWETFKQLRSPDSKVPAKYRELLQLAVASQIPCNYCIYFHTASAMAFGATHEEIQEAIALGADTRHWSMILQGNQIEFDKFKAEFDSMMDYMAEKSKE